MLVSSGHLRGVAGDGFFRQRSNRSTAGASCHGSGIPNTRETMDPNPVVLAAGIRFFREPVRPALVSEWEQRGGMGLHLTKNRQSSNQVSLKHNIQEP